jgi:hypothetical protein
LLLSAVNLATFSYTILLAKCFIITCYTIVAIVIANYIEDSLEHVLRSPVVELWGVRACVCVYDKQDVCR